MSGIIFVVIFFTINTKNMKSTLFALLACTLIMSGSERMTPENMSVRTYIRLLKEENYDFIDLPPFGPEDIPELLKYASEDLALKNYPHNPISSLMGEDCRLGVYVLWTIESIRKSSVAERTSPGRFPSLNPILAFKLPVDTTVDMEESHKTALQAYINWWLSGEFEQIKYVNPLETTEYFWR
jgi:hypothetical protein